MEKLKKKNWGKLLQENSALLSLILLLPYLFMLQDGRISVWTIMFWSLVLA